MTKQKKPNTVDLHAPLTLEGVITAVRAIKTDTGKPMAFVLRDCQDGPAEVVFFPELYLANADAILEGTRIKVKALRDCNKEGEVKYLVDEVVR